MLATHSLPPQTHPAFSLPRVYSASDLCKAMLAGKFDDSGLDRVLRHDSQHGVLEVQAATPWQDLPPQGCSAFGDGTVGESVAANAPGPDGRPVAAHVRSLTIATPDGELRRASREHAPDLFRLAVGGFGALGTFYSITLDLKSLSRASADAVAPVCLELPEAPAGGTRCRIDLLAPPAQSEALAGRVRDELDHRHYALKRLEVRRTLTCHDAYLGWASREYAALRIECRSQATLGGCVGAAQLRMQLIEFAIAAGGIVAPASLPAANRAQAAACYPMLGGFLAEQRRYDPAGRVGNAWIRAVRDLWRRT